MSHIYLSKESDPYFNVAAEYELFSHAGNCVDLFLWQNQAAVILGRNQNIYAECDMHYLEQHNILPVRRFSGGGTVFQDMGNINFSFISKEANADTESFLFVIKNALTSLGIASEYNGRNDLLCSGRKFSGHAYYTDSGNYLYHGTIMVNVDLTHLSHVLKPSSIKLASKGIDSVRSRVVNLSQINPDLTVQTEKNALVKSFEKIYHSKEKPKFICGKNTFPEILEKLHKTDWLYGEAPFFQIESEAHLSFGNVRLWADVKDGRIQTIKIYTDSLACFDFSACERALTGYFFCEQPVYDFIEAFMTNGGR